MKCSVYPADKFADFTQQWNSLNAQTHRQAILDADFVSQLIRHFFAGNEYLVVAESAGQLQFIGFFQRCGFGRWQTVMPSQAPLGLWLAAQHSVDNRLLQQIAAALPGLVLQVDLLQADSRALRVSQEVYQQFYIETGNRPVPEKYDDFAKTIGKNLRQNCNKAYNRAERENDVLEAKLLSNVADVADGVLRYAEIESQSWKAKQGTALSPDNTQGKFYADMMTTLAQRNAACVWCFLVSGNIAAVDLCVNKDGNLIILKTTFDEQYSRYSPALLLKLDMLKYYTEHPELGINNIEFYGKAMDWHKRLNSELRHIVHLSWQRTRLLRWIVRKVKQLRQPSKPAQLQADNT
jgi:CelD/BcsL family acetyltransferase involved in cellulose biosynthesis